MRLQKIKVKYIGWPLINLFMKVYTKGMRQKEPQNIGLIIKVVLCVYFEFEIIDDLFNNPVAEKMLVSCQRLLKVP